VAQTKGVLTSWGAALRETPAMTYGISGNALTRVRSGWITTTLPVSRAATSCGRLASSNAG
jgi:hypothetical protein